MTVRNDRRLCGQSRGVQLLSHSVVKPKLANLIIYSSALLVCHYHERKHVDKGKDCSGNKSNALPVNSTRYL